MFPYIERPNLDLGFYQLKAFPVLVGAAIVAQFQIVLRRAPRFGIDRRAASSLSGWAIFLGIVGAHVFDVVVYYPERLVENPLVLVLGLGQFVVVQGACWAVSRGSTW